MNNTNFTICKANQEQREYVFERVIIKDEEEKQLLLEEARIFEQENLIAYDGDFC